MKRHCQNMKRVLRYVGKPVEKTNKNDLRVFLRGLKDRVDSSTYKNYLASMKRFYRDFLERKGLVDSFQFPTIEIKPKIIPKKKVLRQVYRELKTQRNRALFLMFASSGLRHGEVLGLNRYADVDYEKRMLKPKKEGNQSKHVWVSFYNTECERELNGYLNRREDDDKRLFPISRKQVHRILEHACEQAGADKITPQQLRVWFSMQMAELGVQDRFVDCLCGRTPKSVLAKHYTDYSPERLKRIYDKAGLKVLC